MRGAQERGACWRVRARRSALRVPREPVPHLGEWLSTDVREVYLGFAMVQIRGDVSPGRVRQAAQRVGQALGCRLIVLFGSASRGEAVKPQDLDLGILGQGRLDTVTVTNRLIRELGVQEVDVADLGRADPLLLALVARDGTPVYEACPGEFARFASLAIRRYADTRKFREVERQEIRDRLASGSGGR